ncbi:MAG: ankyrin repeat domain-containing protein [Marinobacter sp.]|nr:ankyrin repeat domain-containing protein [Marinobacter sp.]
MENQHTMRCTAPAQRRLNDTGPLGSIVDCLRVGFVILSIVVFSTWLSGCANKTPPLMKAIDRGDDAAFYTLLAKNPEHADRFKYGDYGRFECPLHLAASLGRTEYVAALLNTGVDANQLCWAHLTPLRYAGTYPFKKTEKDNYALIRLLLESGASTESLAFDWLNSEFYLKTAWGRTFTPRVLALWLEYGADLPLQTLLVYAAQVGDIEMVQVMLEAGADLDQRDEQGRSLYRIAADNNQQRMMFYLAQFD